MQARGSYKCGKMLFLGVGIELGSTMAVDGIVELMELSHLPYKKATSREYVGLRGLKKHDKKKRRNHVGDVIEHLIAALDADDVVLARGT